MTDPLQSQGRFAEVRWLSLVAAISSITLVGVVYGLSTPLLSVIMEKRGYSATVIGLNTAVAGLASIAAAPLAIALAARLGVARTMIIAVLTAASAFVAFYLADAFWLWFPLRAVMNAAITLLFILSEYWISTAAPPHRRGLVLGAYATVLSLGFALGPWLFSQVGSEGFLPFGVTFLIALVAVGPLFAAGRESPPIEQSSGGEGRSFLGYVWLVPTATAAVLVFGAAETGSFALFPLYGSQLGHNEADTALLLSMIGLGNVVLQIPLGFISDRVGDRRILLLVCGLAGLAGALVLPFVASSWTLTAMLLFVWGGFIAALYTIGLAHLGSKLSGRDLASANAAFVFCYGIGMTIGPQAIGIGMDATGSSGFPLTLALLFALYAALVTLRLVRSARRP